MAHTRVSKSLLVMLSFLALAAAPAARQTTAPASPQTTAPAAVVPAAPEAPPAENPQPFKEWVADFVTEARGRGYSEALLKQTVGAVEEPLPHVIQSDRSQAELNPGFNRYLDARVTRAMTTRGKEMARDHARVLARIETTYNVQRRFLVAIWGIESRYGRLTGRTPVFTALATLAWEPRRSEFFRNELYHALMMVDRGYIDAASMTGSWAGAMGQTQFMPTSYMNYAVDFDADGRRDIWKTNADVLASIANYLKGFGWTDEETWGREVRVGPQVLDTITSTIPKRTKGCYAIRNMTERRPLAEWRALGVTRADGGPLPTADITAGLVDVGERKFLVYPNYDAILGYNCAHYYALTVALLGDTLR